MTAGKRGSRDSEDAKTRRDRGDPAPSAPASRRPSWIRNLERLGWKLALKHDLWAASKMEGAVGKVNKFYDFVSPVYDFLFRRLEGFQAGGERLVSRVVKPGDRILDLGTGTGMNLAPSRAVTPHFVGLDLNFAMTRQARKLARKKGDRAHWIQGSALELPFATGSFDVVLSSYMMVYLSPEQTVTCLSECRRVLGSAGRVGILCGQGERSPRNPRREEWVEHFLAAGFPHVEFDDFYDVLRIVYASKGDPASP